MSLINTQHAMIHALFNAKALPSVAQELIQSDARLTAEQRLGIYRHSVQGILLQHLRSIFGVVEQLVGAEFFEYLTETYIDQYPPTHPSLGEYGDQFAGLLWAHPALAAMPWVADIGRLEWARLQAWQGVNQAPSDFSQLSTLSAEEQGSIILQLPDSAQVIESKYAIHDVWLAHQPEAYEGKPQLETLDLHVPSYVLIYRKSRQLHQYALTPQYAALVQAVQHAHTLDQLGEQFGEYLAQILPVGLQQGWIYAFVSSKASKSSAKS